MENGGVIIKMLDIIFDQERPSIYFGHPMNTYNTPLEERLLQQIQSQFPNASIVNPMKNFISIIVKHMIN